MKKGIFVLVALFFAFAFTNTLQAQCGAKNTAKAIKVANKGGDDDVVDIAISSKEHTTLVAAVQAADLVETLKSEGPFTIFAPVNKEVNKISMIGKKVTVNKKIVF